MDHFPSLVRKLPRFDGPFEAFRLAAERCDVLFASYPAGTIIAPHSHKTENIGVITAGRLFLTIDGMEKAYGPGDWYHVPANTVHSARFEAPTSEIELWFQ
jgi:quercetin dioxygenase-like cupin family protein